MLEFLRSAKFKIFLIVICTVMAGSVIAIATVSSSSPITSVAGFAFKPLQKISGFISDKVSLEIELDDNVSLPISLLNQMRGNRVLFIV